MLRRPVRLVALAALLLLALPMLLQSQATIRPADAPRHEGTRVTIEGVVHDVRPYGEGFLLDLRADGHAVMVRADEPMPRGAWVAARGLLLRSGTELRLLADDVTLTEAPRRAQPTWAQLAAVPHQWEGRALRLEGLIERGELRHDGHAVRLGEGDWQAGPAHVEGALAYHPPCLCYRLHGTWTP